MESCVGHKYSIVTSVWTGTAYQRVLCTHCLSVAGTIMEGPNPPRELAVAEDDIELDNHWSWNYFDGMVFVLKQTPAQRLASGLITLWLISLSYGNDPTECVCQEDQFRDRGHL